MFSSEFNGEICAVAAILCLGVSNIRFLNLVERVQVKCDMIEGCLRANPLHLQY